MCTSDLDVLQSTLNLIHRPAQQYSSVSSFELNENTEIQGKLLLLATAGGDWGRLKQRGWGLVKLAQFADSKGSSPIDEAIALPDNFFSLQAQFYRPTQITPSGDHQAIPETPDTKQLLQPTSELRLGSQDHSPTSPSTPIRSGSAALNNSDRYGTWNTSDNTHGQPIRWKLDDGDEQYSIVASVH
jgi:hypothetical protein